MSLFARDLAQHDIGLARPQPTDMRIPILIVALVCAVAGAIGEVTREPWPLPLFPSFGAIPTESDLAAEDRSMFVFHHGGDAASLSLDEVFEEPVGSFYSPMTDSFAAIDGDGSDQLSTWANTKAQQQLEWSVCVEALTLVSVSGQTGQATLINQVAFPQCR